MSAIALTQQDITRWIARSPAGSSQIWHNIEWTDFHRLLEHLGEVRSSRVAYDRGTLEIIMPSQEHEFLCRIIGVLIWELADALELDCLSLGSTTWKQQAAAVGIEPDDCFYLQSEPQIRDRVPNIDLNAGDPPPDLALEIDITSKSVDRQQIYARLGVPEVWRYDEKWLYIYHLRSGSYIQSDRSLAFPNFPVLEIPNFVAQNHSLGSRAWRKAFRQWVSETEGK